MRQTQQAENLRDILTVFFKNKYKVLIVFTCFVLAAGLAAFLSRPVYEARSILLVKYGREYVNPGGPGEPRPLVSQQDVINSEIQILTSPALFKKVIGKMKLERLYPGLAANPPGKMKPVDAAIIRFGKNVKAAGIRKSNVIDVSFRNKDPQTAAAALNLLVELYREKHLQVYSNPHSSFLEKELKEYKQKLKESLARMEAFKQAKHVYSFGQQQAILIKQRGAMKDALRNSQADAFELRQKLSTLKAKMKAISGNNSLYTRTDMDRIIVDANSRLLGLKIEKQQLLKKYKENTWPVMVVRKEIKIVDDDLKKQEEGIERTVKTANPVYQSVENGIITAEAQLSAQLARKTVLKEQLNQLDGNMRALDESRNEYQNLKREDSLNEKFYLAYASKSEEARITDAMDRQKMANISVIEAASAPFQPVRPKKALYLFIGAVLGLIAGLGAAYFSDYMAPVFSIPEHVEKRLGLPVLATVPLRND